MKKKGFTQIDNDLIKDNRLSDSEFRTYLLLKSYDWGFNYYEVFPSQSTLAEIRGKTRKTIIAHLKRLRRLGIIDYWRKERSKVNTYELLYEYQQSNKEE